MHSSLSNGGGYYLFNWSSTVIFLGYVSKDVFPSLITFKK